MEETFSFEVPGACAVTARWTHAEAARWVFVYAPGAGSNLADPFGAFAAEALLAHQISTLRFQFPYSERKRGIPDRPPVLEATWGAAIGAARANAATGDARLVIGGRSMGGRIASMVVAKPGAPKVDALALFAYPLHPPKKPTELRTVHLDAIDMPTLFVSGTNDAFGSPEELTRATKSVKGSVLRLLDRADHSFAVPKSSGRTREEVWTEAVTTFVEWLESSALSEGPRGAAPSHRAPPT